MIASGIDLMYVNEQAVTHDDLTDDDDEIAYCTVR